MWRYQGPILCKAFLASSCWHGPEDTHVWSKRLCEGGFPFFFFSSFLFLIAAQRKKKKHISCNVRPVSGSANSCITFNTGSRYVEKKKKTKGCFQVSNGAPSESCVGGRENESENDRARIGFPTAALCHDYMFCRVAEMRFLFNAHYLIFGGGG